MIEWLVKNPQIALLLLIGVFALFGRIGQVRKEQREKRERAMRSGRQAPEAKPSALDTSAMDDEEAERTRRIQEEIRRKILARMERAQPAASIPRPSTQPPPIPRVTPPPTRVTQTTTDTASDNYRSAMDQLAEMKALAATASANQDTAFSQQKTNIGATQEAREAIAALETPASLRRAFILKEILDKPVSLRM